MSGIDPNADSLTFTVVSPRSHGSLSGTAPNLVYTPEPNYYGPDAVTFTASDGELQLGAGDHRYHRHAGQRRPVLARPTDQTTIEGTEVLVTFAASDIDSEFLTFSVSGLPPGLHFDEASGAVSGAPTTAGTSSVTVTVSDGELSDSRSFTWTVTRGPTPRPRDARSAHGVGIDHRCSARLGGQPEPDLAGYRVYRSTGGAAFVELTWPSRRRPG